MEFKESEKMRLELESFLNSSLKQPDDACPGRPVDLLKPEAPKKAVTGVPARDSSVRR